MGTKGNFVYSPAFLVQNVYMRIGLISNAGFCIPALQLLANNHMQAFVFTNACSPSAPDMTDLQNIRHACAQLPAVSLREADPGDLYAWLESERPDVAFVMGYKHLIDTDRLPAALRKRIFNIHFGALPGFRGPNPVFWQLKTGAEKLATTIHLLDKKFDTGALVWQKQVNRELHLNYGAVHNILSYVSCEGMIYVLHHILQNKELPVFPQDAAGARYYKRPQLQDVLINWSTMGAQEIINLLLACNPWNKGAITSFNGNEIKILDAEPVAGTVNNDGKYAPGSIIKHDNCLHVLCKDNAVLNITMLNMDGSFIPSRHAAMFGFLLGQRFV